jgi:hypothetical protein
LWPIGNVATPGRIPRLLHADHPDTLTCIIFKEHGGLLMSQLEREKLQPQRVHIGAFVDREQRDELVRRSHQEDRTVSAIVRLALAGYLSNRELKGKT